uniref:Uncharacterized protein n=1 Tax=Ralstonia solanacearum TaxID=305 RepID=A0A0S4TY11_RALSL|nr:protein of unknown function [Ralstonia solanacearum]
MYQVVAEAIGGAVYADAVISGCTCASVFYAARVGAGALESEQSLYSDIAFKCGGGTFG